MTDVSGIPNLGIPAMQYGTPVLGGNAATGQPAMSAADINRSIWGSFSPQQGQAVLNNAYGPMGFGGQTAAYSALGAAYGRGTGGFNGGQQVAPAYGQTINDFNSSRGIGGGSPASVDVNSSPFDVGNTGAIPYLSGGGMPFGGGGFGRMPTVFDTGSQGIPNLSSGGMPFGNGGFGTPPSSYTPNFDAAFNSNFSPSNPSIGFSRGRSMPPMSYDAGASAALPPGPPQSRFDPQRSIDAVNQFSGVGTMPQESTAPGQNTGSANPFTSGSDPINNLGSPFAAGRGFQAPPSNPFVSGTTGIGGTMLPAFNDARAGGGVGSSRAPADYAPSSPFAGGGSPFNYSGDYRGSMNNQINQKTMGGDTFTGENNPPFDLSAPSPLRGGFGQSSPFVSGTPPVPFQNSNGQAFPAPGIGGYRGNIRDQIAAAMSGSQGMNEPTSGPPLVNGGPQVNPGLAGGPPTPTPTQPQMDSAWSRIRSGPGSPGISSIAQQTPPPVAPYARINQAIYDIGNASQPSMFDNLSRPLGSMFSPSRGR